MKINLNGWVAYAMCLLVTMLFANSAFAQRSITTTVKVTENFNGMSSTTMPTNITTATVSNGGSKTLAAATGTAVTNSGSINCSSSSGGTRLFGTTGAFAVGLLTSGSNSNSVYFDFRIQNTGTVAITQLKLTFDVINYRVNTRAAVVTTLFSTTGASGSWSTWTSNSIASGGPCSVATSTLASPTFTTALNAVNIAANGTFYVRFFIESAGSNGQGITIDNIDIDAAPPACTQPTTQVTSLAVSNANPTTLDVGRTGGNGDRILILGHQGTSTTFTTPVSGTAYTGNLNFSTASTLGTDKILYAGLPSGMPITVTNLTNSTSYTFAAFAYTAATNCYRILTYPTITGATVANTGSSDIFTAFNEASAGVNSTTNNTTINSNTDGDRVWSFSVRDGGAAQLSDGLPTIITSLAIQKGASNSTVLANWGNTFFSVALFNGTTKINGTVTINANNISITGITNLSIPDLDVLTLDLRLTLKSSLPVGADNEVFQFDIDNADITTDIAANSTQMAVFTAVSDATGTNNDIIVDATKLIYSVQTSAITVNTNASYTVQATDANNNIDESNTSAVTLSKNSGSGIVSASSGLTKSLTAGQVSWTDVKFDTDGTYTLRASNGSLIDVVTGNIIVSVIPYQLFDNFNRTASSTVGIPSSQTTTSWAEEEISGSTERVVIVGNALRVRGGDNSNTGGVTGDEMISFDLTNVLPSTTLGNYPTQIEWMFKFQQGRTTLSGLSGNAYGAAVMLAGSHPSFLSQGNGYAIIFSASSGSMTANLVSYSSGVLSGTTTISSLSGITSTNFCAFRVNFDPCTKLWKLGGLNSASSYPDPTTITTFNTTVSNTTNISGNLPYIGALYHHSNGASQTGNHIEIEDLYIPNANLSPATYTWTGNTSTDYQVATNWTPSRLCLLSNDILIFEPVASSATIINVPNQSIGQLRIPAGKDITLFPANNTSSTNRASLQITGGVGDDLTIAATSSLTLNGEASIAILLKSTANAIVNGTINIRNTTNNSNTANHRLLAIDPNSWNFASGSTLYIQRLAGSIFGTQGTLDSSTNPIHSTNQIANFNSGSSYIQEAGNDPFFRTQPLTKANFLVGCNYEHKIATALNVTGRSFGNLTFDNGSANSNAFTNGTTLTVLNNLTIKGNTTLTCSTATTNSANINVAGNISIEAGSSFTLNGGTTGVMMLTLNGTAPQTLSSVGTFNSNSTSTLKMNNSLGLTLLTDVNLQSLLDLTVGNVNLGNHNLKIYNYSGGSNSSYVRTNGTGRLRQDMTVSTTLVFPVGVNPYMPIAINYLNSANVNTEVSVGAVDGIADEFGNSYLTNAVTTTWNVTTNGNIDDTRFTPGWDVTREGSIFTRSNSIVIYRTLPTQQWLRLYTDANGVPFNGPATDLGGGRYEFTSAKMDETITSGVTHFIGVMGNLSTLPVKLTAFTGKVITTDAQLNWATAGELNNSHFDVERSTNGANFTKVGEVQGNGTTLNNKAYTYTDEKAFAEQSVLYYRLRQVDYNGKFEYSPIVALSATPTTVTNTVNIYPVPATDAINISGLSSIGIASVTLVDAQGRVVSTQAVNSANTLRIDLTIVPAGIYYIRLTTAQGRIINKLITKR